MSFRGTLRATINVYSGTGVAASSFPPIFFPLGNLRIEKLHASISDQYRILVKFVDDRRIFSFISGIGGIVNPRMFASMQHL